MGMLQKGKWREETCRISRCQVVSHQDSLVKALKALDKYSLQGHGNAFLLACKKHAVHGDASKRHVERGDVSDLTLPGRITPRIVGQGSESIG